MNERETGMVLEMIRAHYWQTLKSGENDRALMLRTWSKALDDVPLRPHIENALEWWFKHEQWPPQASQLRERAMDEIKALKRERENAETLARYSLPAPKQPTVPRDIQLAVRARIRAGEINVVQAVGEIKRLVAEREDEHARERGNDGARDRVGVGMEPW